MTGLDQFLLALFLVIFASGVYSLWWSPESAGVDEVPKAIPRWLSVRTVSDLKLQLVEVIAVILAVLFLKVLLEITKSDVLPWTVLVLPAGVLLLAGAVWLIRNAER